MGMYEAIKDAVSLAQQADNAGLVRQLLDAQKEAIDLVQRLQVLSEENTSLKRQLEIKGELRWEHNVYWRDRDGSRDGPYCQRCWDKDDKLARMSERRDNPYWHCAICSLRRLRPGQQPIVSRGRTTGHY